MVINVTQKDIDRGGNPIYNAIKREYGIECIVDPKYIVFKDNQANPFRLPLSAEGFNYAVNTGVADLEPFSFEIAASYTKKAGK